jgi:catechol 2,3-dioxygenase-like lactoylglutathione lyase family enzyme
VSTSEERSDVAASLITGIDHVQVAIPAGAEDTARSFYGMLLGMSELAKPPALATRGGCWFTAGSAVLHLGVQEPFVPASKAHPAFLVTSLDSLFDTLAAAGYAGVRADSEIPGVRRFHVFDPFGNRIEFQQT